MYTTSVFNRVCTSFFFSETFVLQEAIILYRQRQEADPTDTGAILGCMKCMDAMGEWGDLVSLCNSSWDHIHTVGGDPAVARKAATMAAR